MKFKSQNRILIHRLGCSEKHVIMCNEKSFLKWTYVAKLQSWNFLFICLHKYFLLVKFLSFFFRVLPLWTRLCVDANDSSYPRPKARHTPKSGVPLSKSQNSLIWVLRTSLVNTDRCFYLFLTCSDKETRALDLPFGSYNSWQYMQWNPQYRKNSEISEEKLGSV